MWRWWPTPYGVTFSSAETKCVGEMAGERRERQDRGGRVAAGVGDEARVAHRLAVALGQAVHRLADQLGVRVLDVPALVLVDVSEAEIGAEVDDLDALGAQRRHHGRRGAVRVGDDGGVRFAVAVEVELLERERHAVIRVEVVEPAAGVAAARHRDEVEVGVTVHELRGERARVARGARDDDARHASHLPARRSHRD
jgi:hypothetical protein